MRATPISTPLLLNQSSSVSGVSSLGGGSEAHQLVSARWLLGTTTSASSHCAAAMTSTVGSRMSTTRRKGMPAARMAITSCCLASVLKANTAPMSAASGSACNSSVGERRPM